MTKYTIHLFLIQLFFIISSPKCNKTLINNNFEEKQENSSSIVQNPDTSYIISEYIEQNIDTIYFSNDTIDKIDSTNLSVIPDSVYKPNELRYFINTLMGKISFQNDTNFVPVLKYTQKGGIYLRKEAYEHFVIMADSAKKAGIYLNIISAGREFNHQKYIWENKWNDKYSYITQPVARAKEILNYSAMPGSSRHHWGTEVDINALNNAYFSTGDGKKLYDWMLNNASRFGFCQVYNNKNDRDFKGYNEERWHWSYLPLSNQMLDDYLKQINYSLINGFKGSETAEELEIINNYVKALNSSCH